MKEITLGHYASHWFHRTPRRMLYALTYYKFASRMIGKKKKVLDVGCNEGLGTQLLSTECGYAMGIDFDEEAISYAQQNFQSANLEFSTKDILSQEFSSGWDAIVNFDVIEHILPDHADQFLQSITEHLKPEGISIIGTPSEISQKFASAVSKAGHVNIYSPERLQKQMEKFFHNVFIFAANDEVVHTGYLPLAHYLIAIGCKKKMMNHP